MPDALLGARAHWWPMFNQNPQISFHRDLLQLLIPQSVCTKRMFYLNYSYFILLNQAVDILTGFFVRFVCLFTWFFVCFFGGVCVNLGHFLWWFFVCFIFFCCMVDPKGVIHSSQYLSKFYWIKNLKQQNQEHIISWEHITLICSSQTKEFWPYTVIGCRVMFRGFVKCKFLKHLALLQRKKMFFNCLISAWYLKNWGGLWKLEFIYISCSFTKIKCFYSIIMPVTWEAIGIFTI